MRVTQVCPLFYPYVGGVETHVRQLSERLVNRGATVEVLTTDPNGNLPRKYLRNGVEVRRFRSWSPPGSFHLSIPLARAVREAETDIIHVHDFYDLTSPIAFMSKNAHKKCVFTIHSSGSSSLTRRIMRYPYTVLMRRLVRRVDMIICVSRFESERFQHILKVHPQRIRVIPNGVNPVVGERRRYRMTPPILLALGRLEKYKGHDKVLRAFKIFRSQHPEIPLRLVLVGDGPNKHHLTDLASELHILKEISFLGTVIDSEYSLLLRSSSMAILLSEYESHSIAVAEALAVGVPTILACNSALAEYVCDGYAIGIRNPNDSYEVAEKIASLLLNNLKCRKSNQYRAFTWDEVTDKVWGIYEELLNG